MARAPPQLLGPGNKRREGEKGEAQQHKKEEVLHAWKRTPGLGQGRIKNP